MNWDLLVYLRHRAQPGTGSSYDLDGWELHVHPDLSERLGDIAGSPKAVVPLYGVVIVVVRDIAVAMAEGTSWTISRCGASSAPKSLGSGDFTWGLR